MMRMRFTVALSLMLALPIVTTASGQQLQWQQTLNIPKGANMPDGVKADILGVELGDTYAEAKAKLEKLAAEGLLKPPAKRTSEQQITDEMQGVRRAQPYREEQSVFRLQQRGTQAVVAASFVNKVIVERVFKGAGNANWNEIITVWFSAPSSGHQVIGIERSIFYHASVDQPRVSDLIAQLSKKFQTEPQKYDRVIRFQFDGGRSYIPPNTSLTCRAYHTTSQAQDVPKINPKGDCDVILEIRFNSGISPDHMTSVRFVLSDNERAKANMTADFNFFRDVVRKLQDRTSGETPKL